MTDWNVAIGWFAHYTEIQCVHWPCTKLHKREQKDRTRTLAEFPNHVLKDYDLVPLIWYNLSSVTERGEGTLPQAKMSWYKIKTSYGPLGKFWPSTTSLQQSMPLLPISSIGEVWMFSKIPPLWRRLEIRFDPPPWLKDRFTWTQSIGPFIRAKISRGLNKLRLE